MRIITLSLILSLLASGCVSSGPGPASKPPSDYNFTAEDRKEAMKEYGFTRIQGFQGKASTAEIQSGKAARKETSCRSAVLGIAQVSGFSMSGSGNRKEKAMIVECRSTKNDYEECECDVGFK